MNLLVLNGFNQFLTIPALTCCWCSCSSGVSCDVEAASPILFTVDEVLEVEEVSNILVTPTFNTVAPRDSMVPTAASKLSLSFFSTSGIFI